MNDLKVENRQLMEENARLTDLTRMLLSSPAFSGFLTELSNNGLPVNQTQRPQQQQLASQPQPTRKDVNPHQVQQQMHNQQVGMAMIPEQTVDFSMLDAAPSNGWNSGIDMNSYQVFAVTDVPQGPAVDSAVLSGKASSLVEPESDSESKDVPFMGHLPVLDSAKKIQPTVEDPDVDFDEEEFALFVDTPSSSRQPSAPSSRDDSSIFGAVPLEKALAHIDLTTVSNDAAMDKDVLAEARLEMFLARMDASCARIGAIVSHLQ